MSIYSEIFYELKRLNFQPAHLWRIQQVLCFAERILNQNNYKELFDVLDQMCDEGIFEKIPYLQGTYNYRLTEFGYNKLMKY